MKRSLTHGAGYLIVDHTDSPGLTAADVAHVPGAVPVPSGTAFEADLVTCSHCERGIRLNPARKRDRGYCPKCNRYVCDFCEAIRVKTGSCVQFVKVLDQAQERTAKGLEPLVQLTDL